MITFKATIRASRTGKDKKTPILFRITLDRKSKYISSNYRIKPIDWDDNEKKVKRTDKNAPLINAGITAELSKIERYIIKNPYSSLQNVIDNYDSFESFSKLCFYTFMEQVIKANESAYSYHTLKLKNTIIAKFKLVRPVLNFKDVDKDLLDDFRAYWHKQGNSQNTINSNLGKFKMFVREAVKVGFIEYTSNPFLYYQLPMKPTKDKFLSIEEIELIEKFTCTGWKEIAKDSYLFSFYCAGIRFSDIAKLENKMISKGRLRYVMNKNGKIKDIKLSSQAVRIYSKYQSANKYIFPIVQIESADKTELGSEINSKNSLINKELKLIQKAIGIDTRISFHTARHSFANYCVNKKIHLKVVQELLGHSKITTTQDYLRRFDQDESDQAIDALFG